jgi:hypothetical protein
MREFFRGWRRKAGLVTLAMTWFFGCALAIAAVSWAWPYSENIRILGFPFPSVVFERSEDQWLDFVGPLSLPALVADVVICLVTPHFVLRIYLRMSTHGPGRVAGSESSMAPS